LIPLLFYKKLVKVIEFENEGKIKSANKIVSKYMKAIQNKKIQLSNAFL
jgi:hypothetical protein